MADAERSCGHCGQGLGRVHGNRKYHPDCAKIVKGSVAAAHSAAYRWRKMADSHRSVATPPPAYVNERVSVNGLNLPGDRVLELRAALHPFLLALLEQDRYLRKFTVGQIRRNTDRLALCNFVDDGLTLVALLDDYLPVVRANSQDLLGLIEATVRQAHQDCSQTTSGGS